MAVIHNLILSLQSVVVVAVVAPATLTQTMVVREAERHGPAIQAIQVMLHKEIAVAQLVMATQEQSTELLAQTGAVEALAAVRRLAIEDLIHAAATAEPVDNMCNLHNKGLV